VAVGGCSSPQAEEVRCGLWRGSEQQA